MTTRTCKSCNIEKHIEDFPHRNNGKYRIYICRPCRTNKKYHLKSKYGIILEDYNNMKKQQNDCCAICNKSIEKLTRKKLVVDHNHTTGKIRGLLCYHCNNAVGTCLENKQILKNAISYLNKYEN